MLPLDSPTRVKLVEAAMAAKAEAAASKARASKQYDIAEADSAPTAAVPTATTPAASAETAASMASPAEETGQAPMGRAASGNAGSASSLADIVPGDAAAHGETTPTPGARHRKTSGSAERTPTRRVSSKRLVMMPIDEHSTAEGDNQATPTPKRKPKASTDGAPPPSLTSPAPNLSAHSGTANAAPGRLASGRPASYAGPDGRGISPDAAHEPMPAAAAAGAGAAVDGKERRKKSKPASEVTRRSSATEMNAEGMPRPANVIAPVPRRRPAAPTPRFVVTADRGLGWDACVVEGTAQAMLRPPTTTSTLGRNGRRPRLAKRRRLPPLNRRAPPRLYRRLPPRRQRRPARPHRPRPRHRPANAPNRQRMLSSERSI